MSRTRAKREFRAETVQKNYVHDTMADPSKMEAATGWTPSIALEEGLERVCSPYT
jgi:nucleoside-diphosphate-sugar epimerase